MAKINSTDSRGITKVIAFRTTDGVTHEDYPKAQSHQATLDFDKRLADFIEDKMYSGMSKHDIERVIKENADELRKVLA